MKRTHLYIEEELLKILRRISKQRSTTISELVREALRKVYTSERPANTEFILRETAGIIWKDRKDLVTAEGYVYTRRDTRRDRLGLK
jgi:metal-responsive CopG/Arc/MetJ family transcriptional regulator